MAWPRAGALTLPNTDRQRRSPAIVEARAAGALVARSEILDQARLADPGRTVHDDKAASATECLGQPAEQDRDILLRPDEPVRSVFVLISGVRGRARGTAWT